VAMGQKRGARNLIPPSLLKSAEKSALLMLEGTLDRAADD